MQAASQSIFRVKSHPVTVSNPFQDWINLQAHLNLWNFYTCSKLSQISVYCTCSLLMHWANNKCKGFLSIKLGKIRFHLFYCPSLFLTCLLFDLVPYIILTGIKEQSTAGRCITPKGTRERKGILKEGISNKPNLSESPLSKSGSYLSTLEKSKFHNDGLDFHCLFETDGSSEQDIDITCTQPVSHEKILAGTIIHKMLLLKKVLHSYTRNAEVSWIISAGGNWF